ncbi:MAG: hypothetical protein JST16_13590 [Bdellovibrionales bacterium]|nr:hypothetical protein [Bdellovibrionales bacterium]
MRSRLNATLSGILAPNDYMLIVRKSDDAPDAGSDVASTLRTLPGLSAAIDLKGNPVKTGGASSSYTGPIALTIVFDTNVKQQTVDTFKKLVPDIIGRSDDRDDIKISRAMLRQPAAAADKPPTLVVQNMGKGEGEGPLGMTNLLKIFSMILVSTGLLTWLFGRRDSTARAPTPVAPPKEESLSIAPSSLPPEESLHGFLATFDTGVLGLYLLKVLQRNERNKFRVIACGAPLSLQRKVLATLPTWISKHLLIEWSAAHDTEKAGAVSEDQAVEPASIVRELSLLEKDLAGDALAVQKVFLEVFPLSAFKAAVDSGAKLDGALALRLWLIRPDIIACVKMDEVDLNSTPNKLSDADLRDCYEGLWTLKIASSLQPQGANKDDLKVSRWSSLLNALDTFEDVRVQWAKLKASLGDDELTRLEKRVIRWESLRMLKGSSLKDFLRQIDARDLAWLVNEAGGELDWDLARLMRPLRFRMYQQFIDAKIVLSDAERQSASKRVLALLRECSKEQADVAA